MKATVLTEAYIQQIIEEETRSALLEIVATGGKGEGEDLVGDGGDPELVKLLKYAESIKTDLAIDASKILDFLRRGINGFFDLLCAIVGQLEGGEKILIAIGLVGRRYKLAEAADLLMFVKDLCAGDNIQALVSLLAALPGIGTTAAAVRLTFAKKAVDGIELRKIWGVFTEAKKFVESNEQLFRTAAGKGGWLQKLVVGNYTKESGKEAIEQLGKSPSARKFAEKYVAPATGEITDLGKGYQTVEAVISDSVRGLQDAFFKFHGVLYDFILFAITMILMNIEAAMEELIIAEGLQDSDLYTQSGAVEFWQAISKRDNLVLMYKLDMAALLKLINDGIENVKKSGYNLLDVDKVNVEVDPSLILKSPKQAAKEELRVDAREVKNLEELAKYWNYETVEDLLFALDLRTQEDVKEYLFNVNERKPYPFWSILDVKKGPVPLKR